jgi:TonB family protein
MLLCIAGALCATVVLTIRASAGDKKTPEEIIAAAKNAVSFGLIGPFEMQADIRVATPNGEQKGTYLLDWAAPDRFRREIHLPGYDEISVANGSVMYRKRNLDYTPLAAFRSEELMDPEALVAQVQRDSMHPAVNVADFTGSTPSDGGQKLTELRMTEDSGRKTICIPIPSNIYELICADGKRGWPVTIDRRSTADDEIIQYGDYKRLGFGVVATKRQYFDGGRFLAAADVKQAKTVETFPQDTFGAPEGAEQVDWCDDENPAQRLPLKGPLPIDPQTFQNSEIVDAFVSADGTASRLEIIASGGPVADAGLRKIANLIHFTPTTCGSKAVSSEIPLIIGELDTANAALAGETDLHLAGKGGYTNPKCVRCPQPQYPDAAFDDKVQGAVLVSAVIMPDGQARSVFLLKSLGHGLDQQAINAVLGWQFKPANGPDGKPAAVRMLIEIEFHLY